MDLPEVIKRIFIAILIGTVIGVEREHKNRPAGMRTHVLVCLGACVIAVIESCLYADMIARTPDGAQVSYTMGRISAQVVSGIGFLGAGTIFTAQKKITGLTTAASLWNVGCLGLAVGLGYYVVALAGAGFVIVVLLMLQRVVHVNTIKKVEIKFVHRVETLNFINQYFESLGVMVMDIDFHVDNKNDYNLYTNYYTLKLPAKVSYTDIVSHISEHANVQSIRTTNT